MNIFRNTEFNNHFQQNGYVQIDSMPSEILEQLQAFYHSHNPQNINGFHTTHFSTDKEYKKRVNDGLIQILAPIIDDLLIGYTPAFANFMVKTGGGNNPMPLHADWTYVSEPENISISMWIPLVNTTKQNGCLGVIPYSQHLSRNVRGPKITQVLPPYDTMLIQKMGKLIPIKAGQAILYDHRLLHYSPANNSNDVRPALNISIVPENTEIIHYTCPEGQDLIHKYIINDLNFFVRYDNFQFPLMGEATQHKQLSEVPLIHAEVPNFIKEYGTSGFLKKLRKLFVHK